MRPTRARLPSSSAARQKSRPLMWRRLKPYLPLALAGILVLISLYVRYVTRSMTNSDMETFVLVWYAKLQRHGPIIGLGKDFYNYTPPYLYLLAFATLTSSFIAPLTSVKIIAMIFDVFSAIMAYNIVRLHRPQGPLPGLAAAVLFAGPTMLLNSAVWGQADSVFASFLLACLYLLLINRPLPAVASFSVALAFKLQAIFVAPWLLVMVLWGKIRWYYLLAVPLVYAICMAPAVAFGRTWTEVLTAFAGRAGAGKALTHNAASIYVFFPRSAYAWLLWPAAMAATLVFLGWVYYSWRATLRKDLSAVVLLALVSVTLVPFLLPNMRERYYYLGDVLSLILAFITPALWYVPILFQILSLLSYSMFLWAAPPSNLQGATVISLFTLVVLLRHQALLAKPAADSALPARRSKPRAVGRP